MKDRPCGVLTASRTVGLCILFFSNIGLVGGLLVFLIGMAFTRHRATATSASAGAAALLFVFYKRVGRQSRYDRYYQQNYQRSDIIG